MLGSAITSINNKPNRVTVSQLNEPRRIERGIFCSVRQSSHSLAIFGKIEPAYFSRKCLIYFGKLRCDRPTDLRSAAITVPMSGVGVDHRQKWIDQPMNFVHGNHQLMRNLAPRQNPPTAAI